MSRRRSRPARLPPTTTPVCCFCGFSEDDEVEFGKLWNHQGIVTHYYCLLLSSNMEQNGNDNQGILGFLPADIQKELRRGKRLSCAYCKRTGATLGCCNTRCKRVFHLPCGLQAGSLHQFFGEFRSFCITHRIKQEIDEHIKEEAAAAGTVTCYICYEEVNPQNNIRTLWAPCCRKNAWFHRKCVQRLALSAGYFFKCPLCNNKQEFQQAMLEHGIFIPNQDASWELVPNAYQELLHRHNRCDAVECLCPKGRSHTGVNAKWELILCRLCGSQGVHKACGHLKLASSVWECAECVGMLRKTNEATPGLTNQHQQIETTNETSEDESSSDSEISVGRNPSPLLETDRPNSPSPVTFPVIKSRPGPRSFKLQQAFQNAKSAESAKTGTADTSVPENHDILSPNSSNTEEDAFPNEKSNSEESQVKDFLAEKGSLTLTNPSPQTNGIISEESYASPEIAIAKPIEPRRREAEVIVIDSDDEVEIISVQPKQNILTTIDGTKIPIHSLFQVSGEPQKAEGDVKVAETTHPQVSEPSTCQSHVIPAKESSIENDAPSLSNTLQKPAPPLLHSSNVPKSLVTSRNAEDSELIVVNEVVKQSSVMTFKITNVTSLRQEEFTNTIHHSDVITKIDISGDGRSDSSLSKAQQVRITEIANPVNGTPKLRTTAFQLSAAAIKDLNVKRKSGESGDQNLSDLPVKDLMECHKRARTCDSRNSELVQQDKNSPWSIKFGDTNGVVPILATSVPSTCSTNSNRFQQSTAALQTNNNGGVRFIYNPATQKRIGFYTYPSGMGSTSSVRNKTKNNVNHVNLPTNAPSPIVSQGNSLQVCKVTRTYGSIQPQTAKRLSSQNMGANNTNTHGGTHSSQQFTANGSTNFGEFSSGYAKPQMSTQQITNSSESVALTTHSVYQSHANVDREMQRFSNSGGTFQQNLSATDVIFYNGLPRNCTETPTGSTGNQQPSLNNVSKPSHSITQLANGIPISSGCDGDAGSSPAIEAGLAHQAASRSPVYAPTKPDADATSAAGQSAEDHSSISTGVSANPTNVRHDSSVPTARKHCDKSRLIPENVPLQNLKFRVLDSKIVQVVLHDTYLLNISVDTANRQNTQERACPRSSMKEQKLPQSFTQRSNSISQKLCGIENESNINFQREHDLTKIQQCSEIADTPKGSTSLTPAPHNLVDPKSNNSDISRTPTAVAESKTKPSCALLTRSNIGSEISDSYMKQASLAGNGSYYGIQKTNSIGEISASAEALVYASFEGSNRNSCVQHKENLSKEETACPAFSQNNRCNLKNLCERDDKRIFVDNSGSFRSIVKHGPVKTVEHENSVQSVCSVDFCTKTRNCSNNKDGNQRSNGLSRVSKCLVKSFDDSSKLNLSIDCYNNFKKSVDRGSELNCNIKALDTEAQDSLRNNAHVSDFGAVNGNNNEISFNSNVAKSDKCFDTSNSDESTTQIVNMNSMANSSCALRSSENINSDIFSRKPINTAIKDRISSLEAENTLNTCKSDLGIKVRIDLNKIQNFIDSKPQLFDKRIHRKRKLSNKSESKPSQILVRSRHFRSTGANNCAYFSKIEKRRSVQDTDNLHTRKKFKCSSESYEKHSNS